MKKRLFIAAVNNRYGDNAFLPLAAGLMWGYARKFPEITDAYELGGMLYLKEPIADAIARLDNPDVVALSSYIWNHQWNKAFARAVKEKWPKCVTIAGGVQIPDASERGLTENTEFDFVIYGEGEGAFADFLRASDYSNVGSLIWRSQDKIIVNPRHAETPIEDIPSPYLDGLFDDIAKIGTHKFQALQETNRGCPYSCTFCAWGVGSLSKVRQFSTERVVAEFEWMAEHKIGFLYNADANYGILKRDIELTDALVATKAKYGYPQQMRAAFAKNSNETIFDISKKLRDAGMLKATTLALQSMKDETLTLIKRKNIKYDKLAELSARYEAAGISTYAEIIVGLPGETLQSFITGLDALLEAGQHDAVSIYLCMLLENTEMSAPEYRRAHGIESVPMKALLYHGTPEPDVVEEIQETVIATATMPEDDLTRAVLYGWLLQALHGFGLTQHIARKAREHGLHYQQFYLTMLEFAFSHPHTVVGAAVRRVALIWHNAKRGETWKTVDARFGDVSWPPEELLFLTVACNAERFYDELKFIAWATEMQPFIEEQRAMFIAPEPGSEEEYAREAVWFGRKGPGRKLRLR